MNRVLFLMVEKHFSQYPFLIVEVKSIIKEYLDQQHQKINDFKEVILKWGKSCWVYSPIYQQTLDGLYQISLTNQGDVYKMNSLSEVQKSLLSIFNQDKTLFQVFIKIISYWESNLLRTKESLFSLVRVQMIQMVVENICEEILGKVSQLSDESIKELMQPDAETRKVQ